MNCQSPVAPARDLAFGLKLRKMDKEEIRRRVPYESDAWRELYDKASHVPVAVIYEAGLA